MRLARALQHRAPVYALAIAGCSLDAESMCTLAAALATSTVRKLDVSRNDFGDRGALALADAMATCALVDLDLRQSKLTDSGIAAVVCAAMCGAHDVVRLMCERDAASADGTPRKRLAESGGGGGLSDEALLERTRTIRSGSVSSVLRRVRLEDNRCWTLGARWIARVVECVSSDLKLSVTFGIHRGQITSPEIKQALCHLLCASKLSHVTLVAEEIGPGTSLYREAMLGYQDFLERKRVGARTPTRRSTATLTPITPPVLSPRDSAAEIGTGDDAGDNDDNSDGSDDSKPTTPGRTPASPLASRARPPPEPSAVDVWANLMKKKGGSKVGKYLAKQKPVDNK